MRFYQKFTLFIGIFAAPALLAHQKTIYLHYFGHSDSVIFNLNGSWNRDGSALPTWKLREHLKQKGYRLTTFRSAKDIKQDAAYVVFFNVACSPSLVKQVANKVGVAKTVAFLWEPPVKSNYRNYDFGLHNYFGKIFTWDRALIDEQKYVQFYYPQPSLRVVDDALPFSQKKLCVMIARNQRLNHPKELCSERLSVIHFFENKPGEFDLFGRGWSGSYKNYKGGVKSKIDALKKYKFCIAYENTKDIQGYVTEKIFDCFAAGCVPVYYGASDILEYVPKNCFIDRRDFSDNQVLYDYMKNMDVATYQEYLENIREYVASDASRYFSIDYFIQTFVHGLEL